MPDSLNRIKPLRVILATAFLVGIFLSFELWFPTTRSFPRVPFLIALPITAVIYIERLLSIILIASLLSIVINFRPQHFSIVAIAMCSLLICFDQMRLQPWIYQYLLIFSILSLHQWSTKDEETAHHTLGLLQIIVAILYCWSGVQKLNFTFIYETLPKLMLPLQNLLPSLNILSSLPLIVPGISIGLMETFIGCGLLFPRTRNLCILLAIVMHVMVLGLLIANQYNNIVWAWNITLMLIVILLFWRSDVATWKLFINWHHSRVIARMAQALAIAASLLPILSFCGIWDMYLSGALYSGNTVIAVIHIDKDLFEKLPSTAQQQVFKIKNGEQILPLHEWSMVELNVPIYPEPRVYKQVADQVCQLSSNNSAIELVMKERPTILDGHYQVTRINCHQLTQPANK